ncbi:MAG: 3',5'-cyclic-nucleotide phosphodiesterase [Planctomycetota bacterium]|nr:3',5'-cyclic-nucleotide phosphodiesterase [Planctomycetota bacterium]
MRIQLLPSSIGDASAYQFSTSFLVNDRLAIDAGSLGFVGSPAEQARIRDVILTHAHIDHVASLPIHVENAFSPNASPVRVFGSLEVLNAVQAHLFNGIIWPDFVELTQQGLPFVELHPIQPNESREVCGVTITAFEVEHVVPTNAFVIEDEAVAVAIVTDTHRPADLLRKLATYPNLAAIFLEVTFPNHMSTMAEVSAHLTPAGFARELDAAGITVPTYAIHLKAAYRDQLVKEIDALELPNVEVAEPGRVYDFA